VQRLAAFDDKLFMVIFAESPSLNECVKERRPTVKSENVTQHYGASAKRDFGL